MPTQDKTATAGYSAHHSERVRGEIPIPKETLYFSPKITESGNAPPSEELSRSVDNFNQVRKARHLADLALTSLPKYWIPFRDRHVLPAFFSFAGNTAAQSSHQAPAIDRLGINCYWPDKLQDCDDYFNPPHVDGVLLAVLFQPPGEEDDLLEIADLDTTNESGSGGIGETAEFQPVHFQPGEALILAGKQAERILKVRPCVHRVRKPDSLSGGHRLSLGVFCRLQERAALA